MVGAHVEVEDAVEQRVWNLVLVGSDLGYRFRSVLSVWLRRENVIENVGQRTIYLW